MEKKMFDKLKTSLREMVVIPPCQLGCVGGCVFKNLREMYIELSCPRLGIGLDIGKIDVNVVKIDANSGDCVADVTFDLYHVIPIIGNVIEKPDFYSPSQAHVVEFEETTEKIAISFKDDDDDDDDDDELQGPRGKKKFEITLCQYLDPSCELHIDPSIRFVCIAKPTSGGGRF